MKPTRIFGAALLIAGTHSAPVLGDDPQSALRQFGLIGTWSSDSSKDISQPRVSRLTFAASPEGGAKATAEDGRGDVVITTVYDIAEAATPADDKIKIAFRVATVTRSDGKAAAQSDYSNVTIVFQKAGERIEATAIQFEGLPEIERAIFFEKCPAPTH
jgi:hypothetical protein